MENKIFFKDLRDWHMDMIFDIWLLMLTVGEKETKKKNGVFLRKQPKPHLVDDGDCLNLIKTSVKWVLGERRFAGLCKLMPEDSWLGSGYASGLPFIHVSFPFKGDNEQKRIEKVLKQLVSWILRQRGLCDAVMIDWKDCGLSIQYIMLRYAETKDEEKIIKNCLNEKYGDIFGKFARNKPDKNLSES